MKKSSVLIVIGAIVALLDIVNERVFHVAIPPYVVIASMLVGVVCVLVGYGMSRSALASSTRIEAGLRGRYYLFLFLSVVFGVIIGFFGYRKIYDDVPLWIPVASSIIAFVCGAIYFYWDVFIRQRHNS